MARELVFTVDRAQAVGAKPVTFADAHLYERNHLQEWVLTHPEILGDDLIVIYSEYDGFESSDGLAVRDRLDVLALDRSGRLIVAELKRDRAPSTVTMQALNYAAMMSRFSLDKVVGIYAKFRSADGLTEADALEQLRDWAPEISDDTLGPPAIVLVASDFAPQVTNTALFLYENAIDIRLVQVRLYELEHGQLIATASQLLPVPKAETFMMRPRSAPEAQAAARAERSQRASIPQRLVDSGRFADGDKLQLIVPNNVGQDRPTIDAWLNEDPLRRSVAWRQDPRRPLVWAFDGEPHSFAELIGKLVDEATHQPPMSNIWGPNWLVDSTGMPLHKVADALGAADTGT